jgi:ATP-dependent RNA helicase DeaD
VGAIVNETGLHPHAIGAIEIGDDFSTVELPEEVVDEVMPILRKAHFKGKKVTVSRAK